LADCIEEARRGRVVALRTATLLLAVAAPVRALVAQGVLSQFTYDELRVSGLQVDVGSIATQDLRGALVWGLRLDAGYLAPHVRVLLGVSQTGSRFTDRAVARLNRTLLALVNDPDSNATIDVGRVRLSDIIMDIDLQYVFNDGRPVTIAAGLGAGVHFRNGTGRAIDRTFIEDALDGVAPSLNGTLAVGVALVPSWRLTGELRGALLSDYSTAGVRVGFQYRFRAPRSGP
jgi:hypothetical protein